MNKLIYGKQDLGRIVSVEIMNDVAELYLQTESGEIELYHHPNEFYILSNKSHGKNWVRLKGELHYKWAKKYTNTLLIQIISDINMKILCPPMDY